MRVKMSPKYHYGARNNITDSEHDLAIPIKIPCRFPAFSQGWERSGNAPFPRGGNGKKIIFINRWRSVVLQIFSASETSLGAQLSLFPPLIGGKKQGVEKNGRGGGGDNGK